MHFYDVGDALAVLIDLPDDRHILIDAGDDPRRAGCDRTCTDASKHLVDQLAADLGDAPLALVWVTDGERHNVGGLPAILAHFRIEEYFDSGVASDSANARRARRALSERRIPAIAIGAGARVSPLQATKNLRLSSVSPSRWPGSCGRRPGDCSLGLRIDYCRSSILFVGDMGLVEERLLELGGHATLLQVANGGANGAPSSEFVRRVAPHYAVISAGQRKLGSDKGVCNPDVRTVRALTDTLGGRGARVLNAFDGSVACRSAGPEHWVSVPSADTLWSTARDGDVVLVTTGDGVFARVR